MGQGLAALLSGYTSTYKDLLSKSGGDAGRNNLGDMGAGNSGSSAMSSSSMGSSNMGILGKPKPVRVYNGTRTSS